jgi:hypothetical protein
MFPFLIILPELYLDYSDSVLFIFPMFSPFHSFTSFSYSRLNHTEEQEHGLFEGPKRGGLSCDYLSTLRVNTEDTSWRRLGSVRRQLGQEPLALLRAQPY